MMNGLRFQPKEADLEKMKRKLIQRFQPKSQGVGQKRMLLKKQNLMMSNPKYLLRGVGVDLKKMAQMAKMAKPTRMLEIAAATQMAQKRKKVKQKRA